MFRARFFYGERKKKVSSIRWDVASSLWIRVGSSATTSRGNTYYNFSMSFWLTTKRVARYGIAGFVRNGFVSLAAVFIMTITLFVVAGLIIAGAALNSTLDQLTNKVDVTVYFTLPASEDQIADVRQSLEALPEVASITYVSRDQALAEFRERHKNDQLTIQALD